MSGTANAAPIVPTTFPILPLGTSLAGNLQGTFGVVIVAVIISAFLTGILTLQTYTYYSLFPRDSTFRKSMVALIFALDFAQFICITDFGWWYLVRNWGNVEALAIIRPTYGLFVIFGSIVIFVVQCLFLQRIWALDKRLRYLIIPIFLLISVELAFGLLGGSFGVKVKPFASINTHGFDGSVVAVWLGSGVAADVALAVALSYILHVKRTGFRKTDNLITKLILYSVNTCLLTSVVAFLNIIFFYKQDVLQNVHLICNMILCRLFSNSLLASYNRRASLRSEEGSQNSNSAGILVQTDHTTDANRRLYTTGQQSTVISMGVVEPKPLAVERNWDYEMYPVGNKSVDMEP
ncbi:hypothetical protein Clacol_009986 [Clathrus columnatus]|uniref:DUF6534 domain-containing protein n=1 Tax=Clathrus columnatus TaxID=1419009 RepID=A0AAV5AQE0_9AGAM|nr:hypothetical protein Clacol_009986 [Clathrus columnatus]